MTEARAEVTWSQAKGHEDGWQHQRLEETRKTLPWSPRGQAFSPPASRRDRTRFCGLEQPREQIQAAVSLSPLPSALEVMPLSHLWATAGGHRPPQLLQPASQAWSCTSVCVPLEAGGQLGKASLISEDAAAVSGPEDRGSSVLVKAAPTITNQKTEQKLQEGGGHGSWEEEASRESPTDARLSSQRQNAVV
ncbi:uncharacterized protein LOC121019594 isoform X2 [Herpailurus yagouaroundi]|uniref:uncharacterized protein LOC121019594 isoform X2 n=1 Tax=Herpailurus yagouaroundi TaxID=1608482 RepID=UPI001AD734DD|nr:uncharacterized protein LOC121019594 isoform X2 [Puma yagouaroundi]